MESSQPENIMYTELLARETERVSPVNVRKDFGGVDMFLTKVRGIRLARVRPTGRARAASGLRLLLREGIPLQRCLESHARAVRGFVLVRSRIHRTLTTASAEPLHSRLHTLR